MCSSCYRKLHLWIIFTRKAYPVVDRASTQVMFEQLSVEFQMDSYRTTATAAATPEAVRLKRAASRYAPGACMECGAQPKSSPFASQLCEAILPDILRNPGQDSTLAALPAELRSCIAEAAYRVRPHEARMFPLVVSSDPVHIEMVDVIMCPSCYHRAITRSLFPLGGA